MYSESMGDRHFTNQNCGQVAELQTYTTQNVSSADRHYEYRNYKSEDRHYGSRSESSIDRHHRSNHETAAPMTSQGGRFTPYTETELFQTEENTESRYESVSEDTGNAVNLASRSQRYTGQSDDGGRPRVTFSDTYRYKRGTPRGDHFGMTDSSKPVNLAAFPDLKMAIGQGWGDDCPHQNYGWKMPPYNGKEEWKVPINRFEAIADRRNWSEEVKQDNLLPKLQGKAGDFVFTQLSNDTFSFYRELVKKLNSRFNVVETKKTFASKFSQGIQKESETTEEYAANLKHLYAKAYKNRDNRTKGEDLVRRFLDGMRDNDARFEKAFHKKPDCIVVVVV